MATNGNRQNLVCFISLQSLPYSFSDSIFTIPSSLSNMPVCLLHKVLASNSYVCCPAFSPSALFSVFFVQQVPISLDVPKMLGEKQHHFHTLPWYLTDTLHTANKLPTQPLHQFLNNLSPTQSQSLINTLPCFQPKVSCSSQLTAITPHLSCPLHPNPFLLPCCLAGQSMSFHRTVMGSNSGPFWTRDRERSKARGISPVKTLCCKAETYQSYLKSCQKILRLQLQHLFPNLTFGSY